MKNIRYKKGRFIRIGSVTGGLLGALVDLVMGYFLIGVAIGAAIGFVIGHIVEKKMNPNPIAIPITPKTPEEVRKRKILNVVMIILFIMVFLTRLI